ncbi:MAG: DUF1501 domain-containing protein [Planctomycetes bacterium]|nr:DUF1501 domain-containing protein [Planctomycetota bacterium]
MRNGFTRRDFLKVAGVGTAGLAVPGWLTRALAEPAAGASGRSLVMVMLGGGNDGLNTVAPLADPLYGKARPSLAIPKDQLLQVNDDVGFHPALRRLRDLFGEGKVSVVQNVGYAGQDRSHFRSMEIWQTAQTAGVVRDGWLGRCLHCDDERAPHSVSFGSEIPLALWADGGGVLSMENPQAFDVATDQRHPQDRANVLRAFREIYGIPREGPAEFVRGRGLELLAQIERIRTIAQKPPSPVAYPGTGLAQGLRFIANAVEEGLGAKVYLIGLGGFDTHANQRQAHANLLTVLSEALWSFQKDLDARELAGRVVTMTFSEFGRRVAENESQGTDHGAASPLFLMGKCVKGGVVGSAPDLGKLDQGDLMWKVDFRSVYATVLSRWLSVDPDKALGGKFEALDVMGS